MEKRIKAIDHELKSLFEKIKALDQLPQVIVDNMNSLESEKTLTIARIDRIPPDDAIQLAPETAAVYRRKVSELHELLDDEQERDSAFDVIRGLVECIELTPDAGVLRIDLKGCLASMIALCHDRKMTVGELERHTEQLMMVAGVGFEPTTFRL